MAEMAKAFPSIDILRPMPVEGPVLAPKCTCMLWQRWVSVAYNCLVP